MRKRMLIAAALTAGVATVPSIAMAEDHPSQGEQSTGRNDAGFGGGPHCHLMSVEQANGHFTWVRVFPSHQGHVSSGLGEGPFIADPNCDGLPG